MKEKTLRCWLNFWTLFIGLGAVAGSLGMFVDPSGRTLGMDAMLPYFQVLPLAESLYQNFTFPGVVLGGIFGVTLMLWICIQFYIFPRNFMSTAYFIFGLLEALCGYFLWRKERRAQ